MRRLLVVCGIVALVGASVTLAVVWSFAGVSEESGATETAGVTSTAPASATPSLHATGSVISADEARSIFLKEMAVEGTVDENGIAVVLGTAGQWGSLSDLADDYPVYKVSAKGQFHPFMGGPLGTSAPKVFAEASLYISGVSGRILAEDQAEPAELATPATGG
jgi:hypothetical protein